VERQYFVFRLVVEIFAETLCPISDAAGEVHRFICSRL